MRTKEMPLYSGDVLDRMGDKAIFTSDLHTKRWVFIFRYKFIFTNTITMNNL